MTRIVNNRLIQNNQILVWAPTSNINPRLAFPALLHSGHQLNHLHHIFFSQQRRNVFDLLNRNIYPTHVGTICDGGFFGPNFNRPHRFRRLNGIQFDVNRRIPLGRPIQTVCVKARKPEIHPLGLCLRQCN